MQTVGLDKMNRIIELLNENIDELNILRNRLKKSIHDLQSSHFTIKTNQLEQLLHDNDIKIMTLILLQEKIKRIIKS
jgi:hypothetical protein